VQVPHTRTHHARTRIAHGKLNFCQPAREAAATGTGGREIANKLRSISVIESASESQEDRAPGTAKIEKKENKRERERERDRERERERLSRLRNLKSQ
jgi:uncharacterized protein with WD repeat